MATTRTSRVLLPTVAAASLIAFLCVTRQESIRSFLLPSRYAVSADAVKSGELAEREKLIAQRESVIEKREQNLELEKGLLKAKDKETQLSQPPKSVGRWVSTNEHFEHAMTILPDGTCQWLLINLRDRSDQYGQICPMERRGDVLTFKVILDIDTGENAQIELTPDGDDRIFAKMKGFRHSDQKFAEGLVIFKKAD